MLMVSSENLLHIDTPDRQGRGQTQAKRHRDEKTSVCSGDARCARDIFWICWIDDDDADVDGR